jgi:hypothetical protein
VPGIDDTIRNNNYYISVFFSIHIYDLIFITMQPDFNSWPEQHCTKFVFSFFIVIETAPKINLDILQREYKVKKGEDVTIEVKYSSTPKPNDEWFINGRLVKKSKRVKTLLFMF